MTQNGSRDNSILKGNPFRAKVELGPPRFLLPCTSTNSLVRQGLYNLHIFAYLSNPLPPLFFNHNFHAARPHFHILVALEFDQRQDGSTFFISS